MWKETKKILDHRSGSEFEDLIFIDSRTGKSMVRKDYDHLRRVLPSRKMREMVESAPPGTIIAIHNHPSNSVPSLSDIRSAYKQHYKYGIIACHNGKLFKYTVRDQVDLKEADLRLDRINKLLYNKGLRLTENQRLTDIKNLKSELLEFGVDFEEIL